MSQPTGSHGSDGQDVQVGAQPREVQSVPAGMSRIGVHDLVPTLGYREYWYPAVEARKVGKRSFRSLRFFGCRTPVHVKMLGEDVVLFPGNEGGIAALWDRCPHRGAYLSRGRCEYAGTVSCPYHGYTYDETGTCVAALTEGPNSGMTGKLSVRSYPTAVIRGVVFMWMGQTEPVPIAEDVPEEFFDPNCVIVPYAHVWPMNWTLTVENSGDSHNSYLHRFRIRRLFNLTAFRPIPAYWAGVRIVEETDKSIGIVPAANAPQQAYYPGLGRKWPRHVWWRRLTGRTRGVNTFTGKPYSNEYRLPSIARVDTSRRYLHNRYATPIDDTYTLMWTFGIARARHWWQRAWAKLYLRSWYRWLVIKGTNEQEDLPVQRYDRLDPTAPQKLGANDRAIIYWRRRMPLKSRDNLRLWKKGLHLADELEAQEQEADRGDVQVGSHSEEVLPALRAHEGPRVPIASKRGGTP